MGVPPPPSTPAAFHPSPPAARRAGAAEGQAPPAPLPLPRSAPAARTAPAPRRTASGPPAASVFSRLSVLHCSLPATAPGSWPGHSGQRVHVSSFGTKACSGVGGQCYLAWHASSLHSCCSRTTNTACPMVLAAGTALTTHPTAFTIHAQHCLKPAMPTPPAAMLLLHAPHLVLSHHNHQPSYISGIQYVTALPPSPCYVPNLVLLLHPQQNFCLRASHI